MELSSIFYIFLFGGFIRWFHSVVSFGGFIRWFHSVVSFGGFIRWFHSVVSFGGFIQLRLIVFWMYFPEIVLLQT
jgi:hypothetical protein